MPLDSVGWLISLMGEEVTHVDVIAVTCVLSVG